MKVLNNNGPCVGDGGNISCSQLIHKAKALLKLGFCRHVGENELLPNDGRLFIWFDSPCVDPVKRAFKCAKTGSGRLYVAAQRDQAPSSFAMKVSMHVAVFPADVIQLRMGDLRNGFSSSKPEHFTLLPIYPPALPSCQLFEFQVQRVPGQETRDASIDVVVQARRDRPHASPQTLNLPLAAPCMEELKGVDMDLMTVVIAEAVKILIKEGSSFLKEITGTKEEDLIQLHLGSTTLSETELDDANITKALKTPPRLSRAQVDLLTGYNTQYNQLAIRKENLLTASTRTYHPVHTADAKTEVELVEEEMHQAQEKIWQVLHDSQILDVKIIDRPTSECLTPLLLTQGNR